ncbi:MAG: hypothetical protein HW416_1462 [Chloroflexi bacterium]|nr:hypothetical protein [Chloroflexota bacterium]
MAIAATLWMSDDLGAWSLALDAYPDVIAAQGVNGLGELDRWYREDLPSLIRGRTPPSILASELVRVVEWKMRRGEWRARNLALVKGNDADLIRAITEQALQMAPDLRRPVDRIASLVGVGPATASAVLAAYRGDLYPFLDDVIGRAIPELGEPKFTLPYYVKYAQALRDRATALGSPWTVQGVGLAIWSAAGGKAGGDHGPRLR